MKINENRYFYIKSLTSIPFGGPIGNKVLRISVDGAVELLGPELTGNHKYEAGGVAGRRLADLRARGDHRRGQALPELLRHDQAAARTLGRRRRARRMCPTAFSILSSGVAATTAAAKIGNATITRLMTPAANTNIRLSQRVASTCQRT